MPLDNDQIPALCLRWAAGNVDAAAFLVNLTRWVRLADDLADGDSARPVHDMAELLMRLVSEQTTNRFYQTHMVALNPVIANAVILWRQSEEWRLSPNRKTRMFGFVGREAIEHVALTVATITGGFQHALMVAQELHEASHQTSPETFEEWEAE
ncbi:hypothetical protein EBL89_06750 [Cereibacter sphaeroides]|uniref:hypothetical protein n=1 Tax=Cereibacter sphaeroides TaxID=1063 RepID=UPI000F5230E4|nr:hypothetical protein [Cereibacter sphaeroides]AZB55024.1 hypothetical protein EBL89_06750 [Cereibacter sphaeroides]AZB59280.1 hypothetical protein EBL88_06690 [Cereibacter sphaeroides]